MSQQKYYIVNDSDGWCLAEFDHSKHPCTRLKGGYYSSPDAWNESPDPEDGALLFDIESDAQKIIDLMQGDPHHEDIKYWILKVTPPITKLITLSESQLKSLVSTLECTINRQSRFGSFGDSDTLFDSHAIQKVIDQLR